MLQRYELLYEVTLVARAARAGRVACAAPGVAWP